MIATLIETLDQLNFNGNPPQTRQSILYRRTILSVFKKKLIPSWRWNIIHKLTRPHIMSNQVHDQATVSSEEETNQETVQMKPSTTETKEKKPSTTETKEKKPSTTETKEKKKTTGEKLLDISHKTVKMLEDYRQLIELFDDTDVQDSISFGIMFSDNTVKNMGKKLKLCSQFAQTESENWDQIKDLSSEQKAIHYMLKAFAEM